MILIVQIKSLIMSFIYGGLFAIIIHVTEPYLFWNIKVIKSILIFGLTIICALIYFLMLIKINNGICFAVS